MTRRARAWQVSGGAYRKAPLNDGRERPSSFLLQCLGKCVRPKDSLAIDIACGQGRHLPLLLTHSTDVLGIDIDSDSLRKTRLTRPACHLAQTDLAHGIPVKTSSASLVISIHAPMLPLYAEYARVLAPGGFLILETFSGRGENWRNLPGAGAIRAAAEDAFQLLKYNETHVGPADANAVSVKLFARRLGPTT